MPGHPVHSWVPLCPRPRLRSRVWLAPLFRMRFYLRKRFAVSQPEILALARPPEPPFSVDKRRARPDEAQQEDLRDDLSYEHLAPSFPDSMQNSDDEIPSLSTRVGRCAVEVC